MVKSTVASILAKKLNGLCLGYNHQQIHLYPYEQRVDQIIQTIFVNSQWNHTKTLSVHHTSTLTEQTNNRKIQSNQPQVAEGTHVPRRPCHKKVDKVYEFETFVRLQTLNMQKLASINHYRAFHLLYVDFLCSSIVEAAGMFLSLSVN